MTPQQIFDGSNGSATQALYKELEAIGPVGVIALNLFRACKCSGRAKVYSRRFKGDAYGRKTWSLENLCRALEKDAEALGIEWGWKIDPTQEVHKWVLYVEIPDIGQVSFHAEERLSKRDYAGEWDRSTHSPYRIVTWTTEILARHRRNNSLAQMPMASTLETAGAGCANQ